MADSGGNGFFLSQAINKYTGHQARAVRKMPHRFGYPGDITAPSQDELGQLWDWSDVVHIRDAVDYLPHGLRPKPTTITYTGFHYRENHEACHGQCGSAGWLVTVSTADLQSYDEAQTIWLPNPRPDMAHLKQPDSGFTVLHAPSIREAKGTETVIDALQDCDGVGLKLIEGATFKDCLEQKRAGSVLFDQFAYGYGNNTIEAWALGMPVISNASKPEYIKALRQYADPLAFVQADENTDSVREVVKRLQEDPTFYDEMADRGRSHFFKYHHTPVVVAQLLEIYEQALDTFNGTAAPDEMLRGDGLSAPIEMVGMRYIGRNWGTTVWIGDATGKRYEFGLSKPVDGVDSRDVAWLLAQRDRHQDKRLFEKAI